MDEPSIGLSPLMDQEIAKIIHQFEVMGFSVLLIEQNAVVAMHLADHGYEQETGSITMDGAAEKLAVNEHVNKAYLGG
jgi:branched-chain amino acid transport system ATP-binding protein